MDAGQWLIEHRAELDRAEAVWLQHLADFDRQQLWALDGQFTCAGWLVWRTRMARATAFEKLRVAHELQRRPILGEAFGQGRLSYSAVRAITRIEHPDPEVDEALVALAESQGVTISDLEKVVRSYNLYVDQERPPSEDPFHMRDVRILRGDDGTGQVVVTLSDLEVEEFAAALRAFLDMRYRPVDQFSAEDPIEVPTRSEKEADAFMDLVHTALEHADGGHAAGDDRYLVHLVTRPTSGAMTQLDGTPVQPLEAAMVACDSATVAHLVNEEGEPLNLGRKTREWSTAQRRAISVRDGGHCRFVGCHFWHYDIHHIEEWESGGATDVANGCCQCRRHHRMLHNGYGMEGDPNAELRFYRPSGSYIGSTYPVGGRQLTTV